jgi:hypothetical protein
LIGNNATNWNQIEYNENVDSLIVWIADTTVARMDTLLMEVCYLQLDSMSRLYLQKDTVEMNFTDKEDDRSKKKKKSDDEEETPEPILQFNLQTDISGSVVELNKNIGINFPEPILAYDSTKIILYLSDDTLNKPLNIKFEKDTSVYRKYNISYQWKPEEKYTLQIDSAAFTNIFGITSRKLTTKFSAREEDYYGTVSLKFTSVEMPVIVQLLTNSDDEKVVIEKTIDKNGSVLFDYIKPEKYRIKIIYDKNGNGKWDTGSYQDKVQPERVSYHNEVVKVRSNWEAEFSWDLKPDLNFVKKIRDLEEEEKKRKEEEEKARKEKEQENSPQQMQNPIQGSGGSGLMR